MTFTRCAVCKTDYAHDDTGELPEEVTLVSVGVCGDWTGGECRDAYTHVCDKCFDESGEAFAPLVLECMRGLLKDIFADYNEQPADESDTE